ncbi:hypothetical protein B7463_g788, partial [Scytalidium lignicola]
MPNESPDRRSRALGLYNHIVDFLYFFGPKTKIEPGEKWPVDAKPVPVSDALSRLPPPYTHSDPHKEILEHLDSRKSPPVLVVLDDDPTGTQTCHNISVLTTWGIDDLVCEFKTEPRGFFILTNSRAYPPDGARDLMRSICKAVKTVAQMMRTEVEIVLRGDSTLRGHFPLEPDIADEIFGTFDAWIVAPYFFEGGRFTIDDVHYVKSGDVLVPAAQTPFAADASFGYKSSNLRNYVHEKAPGRFTAEQVTSISLTDVRIGGPGCIDDILQAVKRPSVVIVNAVEPNDMDVFCAGLLRARSSGKKFLYRTGAAFVSSRLGIARIAPLGRTDINFQVSDKPRGALIVAGSYVPKTTAQLTALISRRADKLHVIEVQIDQLTGSNRTKTIEAATADLEHCLQSGKDVLLMTSRKLVTRGDGKDNLALGSLVMSGLVQIARNNQICPRYFIAKGGITSSDMASKALGMKRARVTGQAAPGVPVWINDDNESKFPGIPYVVFPGNVGDDSTLAEIVEQWAE